MFKKTAPALLFAAALTSPFALIAADTATETTPHTATVTTPSDGTSRTVGATAKDATITAKVKAKLLADDDIAGMKIDVDTRNQVVALKGTVSSAVQMARAEAIAAKVDGVTKVENHLVVSN